MPEPDAHLADRVHPCGDGLDREFVQVTLHLDQCVDGPVGGVDRTVAEGHRLPALSARQEHAHRRGGPEVGPAAHLQVLEVEGFRRPRAPVGDDRLEVAVGDLTLAVGQLLEAHEGPLEVLVIEAVAEGREPLAEGMAAAQLAEHQAGAGSDLVRLHDLEGPAVLEHAVLMDAGLMSKGVAAHHRLVGLDEHAAQLGDQPGGAEELGVVEAGGHPEDLGVKPDRHRHLLEGGVAGAFADPVDAALHLAGARADADEGVGGGEAEVVVAVHRDGHVLQGGDLHVEPLDELAPLVGSGVADRVGEVDGRRPRLDAAVQHLGQVVRLGAGRVHGRVLDVVLE